MIKRDINNISNLWAGLFVFVIIIYPYIFVAYMVYPLQLMGFNLYFAIVTIVLSSFFVVKVIGEVSLYRIKLIVSAILLYAIFLILHIMIYDEPIGLLSVFRIGITPIIFLFIAEAAQDKKINRILSNVVVANALIQALIGIIHTYFYPNIITGHILVPEGELYTILPIGQGGIRENGVLVNSSLYANIILLGLFLLVFKKKSINNDRGLTEYIAMLVMVYGIVLSGSRYASAIAFVLMIINTLGYIAHKKPTLGKTILSWAIVGSFAVAFFIMGVNDWLSLLYRLMEEGMGVRTEKNMMIVNLLQEDILHLLVGVKTSVYASLQTENGIGFSDNSFLTLGLSFGILYVAVFVAIMAYLIKQTVKIDAPMLFFLFYFFGILFLTNAIYWDIYLVYFFVTLYALSTNATHEPDRKEKYLNNTVQG